MPRQGGKFIAVSLLSAIGPVCGTREAGEKLKRLVTDLLNEGDSVKLDFHGVKLVTPSFYSAAFADLYRTFPEEDVSERVTISQMPALQLFPW